MHGNAAKKIYHEEIFTAQVASKLGTFYFHVAAGSEHEVMTFLQQRDEYKELRGVSRIDIYDGELFARLPGQKPIKRYSCATSLN